jgi:hypothetical protein
MLQNAYFIAKIGADTAENEQHFAEILPIGRCDGESNFGAKPTPNGRLPDLSTEGCAGCTLDVG